MIIEKFGVRRKGEQDLLTVEQCCSQIEGGEFDGPILYDTPEEILSAFMMGTTREEFIDEYEIIPVTLLLTKPPVPVPEISDDDDLGKDGQDAPGSYEED